MANDPKRSLEADRAMRSMQIGAIEIAARQAAPPDMSLKSILAQRKAEHDKASRIAQRNWLRRKQREG